jgi:DNA invertase Pin-like site-specific DNA recombinase
MVVAELHAAAMAARPPTIAPKKLDTIVEALRYGMSKAAICRIFSVKRTTLIENLDWIGWPLFGASIPHSIK